MPTINVSFQVLPQVPGGDTYPVVDQAIAVVQQSGVKYEVGPMETTMEGELDELLEIVKRAQQACIDAGAKRVMTTGQNRLCSTRGDHGREGGQIQACCEIN